MAAWMKELMPAFQVEEALKKSNIRYELYIYEGVNHAFHNDTSTARYNEAATKLAWKRTLDSIKNICNGMFTSHRKNKKFFY